MPRRAADPGPAPKPAPGIRMAELSKRSGVARETIHFYLREGLLPRPEKGGQTVAYYGEAHLERLALIRRLREEKYLPIAVIRRLLASPAATAERDVDVLADVLHLIPLDDEPPRPASPAALHEAEARKLLGPRPPPSQLELEMEPLPSGSGPEPRPSGSGPPKDPEERRVLRVVDDALRLTGDAQRLTLDDLEACASSLTVLVEREAELVFDAMFESGDVRAAISALRSGRPAVARFITAYRDLMLRRVVEEVLLGLERGPELVLRSATIPLSPAREADLGVPDVRAKLHDAWLTARDPPSAAHLVWHLFGTGAARELAQLPPDLLAAAGPRLAPLPAWGALEIARAQRSPVTGPLAALERAATGAPDLALGQILLGEAVVARGLRRRHGGASLLDQAIPALHRVLSSDPDRDPEPVARAFGWFHRGRVALALPPVLGRTARAVADLQKTLATLAAEPSIEPAARARVAANALLSLGRHRMASGRADEARKLLEQAASHDPEGMIGQIARREMASTMETLLG